MARIDWVIASCRLLGAIGDEFAETRPFAGRTIGTGIHLEPKTVALLLTLRRGGAEVISTGNLATTQQEAIDHLTAHGVAVVGGPTSDPVEHDRHLRALLGREPDLLLDNGGDLFVRFLEAPYGGLVGGTEETTSGRARLAPLRDRLALPILVINDSPLKLFGENHHAVGQSTLETLLRITNRTTNGRRATVFGYGSVGSGVAANLRRGLAIVSVVELDPVLRLRALLDGFAVPTRETALRSADIVVTATGAPDVITAADLDRLADDVILLNVGHFPWEIDVAGLRADPRVAARVEAAAGIETLELDDGRRLHVLTEGTMANLAGPRPLGNSIESMDLGFALQARCLEAVATGAVVSDACVVPVPRRIDEAIAAAYVELYGSGPAAGVRSGQPGH
jgi:adenosylhomocysteinase